MNLVVGATGQLGSLVVRRLRADGQQVRAMVRDPASAGDLAATGAELAVADLGRPGTLDGALEGVDAVVATANAIAPIRRSDSAALVDVGYAELVRRAERAGVRRFVLASVPETPLDQKVPVARSKRRTEQLLGASALSWLSLRMPPFSEVWLALVGSEIPLRGEERTTLTRAYPTLRRFRRVTGRTVERRGVMVVPGPPSARQAFLSVHDAATGLAGAVGEDSGAGPVDLGGPESLSWTEVAEIYARVLGRRVRVVSQPAGAFAVGQRVLAPVAPALGGVMGLNRLMATSETDWNTADTAARLGLHRLRTVEEILREKAALPPIR
ncbi:MAG TPA: NAD(P)H-binding protein [Blastococcus sp.]|nr:NAD(P)H-binding protein [Blastococcus sp.]